MPMLVMNVRVMRMAVRDGLMPMLMRMRLGAVPGKAMWMLMVRIMHVRVAVQRHRRCCCSVTSLCMRRASDGQVLLI